MNRGAWLFFLLLLGCSRSDDALPQPAWGSATCAGCAAVIGERRHAAQLQRADGTVLSFDDPACLLRALRAEAHPPRAVRFHGPADGEWIDASVAWFAKVPGQATPHGENWAAFPSFAAAQDAVAQAGSGEILPFDQARQRVGQ
jgi:nitrous oxide reductase accessory protein NosL